MSPQLSGLSSKCRSLQHNRTSDQIRPLHSDCKKLQQNIQRSLFCPDVPGNILGKESCHAFVCFICHPHGHNLIVRRLHFRFDPRDPYESEKYTLPACFLRDRRTLFRCILSVPWKCTGRTTLSFSDPPATDLIFHPVLSLFSDFKRNRCLYTYLCARISNWIGIAQGN